MPSKTPRQLRVPIGLLVRVCLAAIAVLLNHTATGSMGLLPWALLVVLVDITASYLLDGPVPILRSRHLAEWTVVAVAGLASAAAVSAGPGALVLLLVPAAMAGQRLRPLGAGLVTALVLVLTLLIASRTDLLTSPQAITFQQRVGLVSIGAFLVAWAFASRHARTDEGQLRAGEAAEMLEHLTHLATGFNRGFDGPAHAEDALSHFVRELSAESGQVSVADPDGRAQTWALSGSWGEQWPEVDTPDSPLAMVWEGKAIAIPQWQDSRGRVRALLAAPLSARDGSVIGLLIASRQTNRPFTDAEVALGRRVARHHETFIELSSLFAWLRDQALFEERDRLSRQMHDGIGQEIAALGYQLDAVRMLVQEREPDLEPLIAQVRSSLSEVASDVRLHITDLRRRVPSVPRAHLAIETRLAAFRAATGVPTVAALGATPKDLGTGAELALYRVVNAVLRDAAECDPTRVSVQLQTRADTVTLVASHNGATHLTLESLLPHTAMVPRADVSLPERSEDGVVVRVVLVVPLEPSDPTPDRKGPNRGATVTGAVSAR
ncbi:GAF domain-containing sensor histidine kinase [Knoellia sinensis]|uniref:GAF domain-containing sensor histidine kinase n=1 Tax=Knoellia sinensis TaxID=136100 RepID=UPI0014705C79|nr:histidine kinase [Knoellia sinensis]